MKSLRIGLLSMLVCLATAEVSPSQDEHLLVLEAMHVNPTADLETIIRSVMIANPAVSVSVNSVRNVMAAVWLCTVIPAWFHDALVAAGPEALASHPSLIADVVLAAADPNNKPYRPSLYTRPFVIEFIATAWLRNCVWPLRLFPNLPAPCLKMTANFFGEEAPAWRLSEEQQRHLIALFTTEQRKAESPDFDDIFSRF